MSRQDISDGPEGDGGPSGDETGGGGYDHYLPAGLPGDDEQEDHDYQGEPAQASGVFAERVLDLGEPAEVAPAF